MKLILVESPTKSKTLGKFLGKDYKILSTKGHIRDLPKKSLGVDIENNFEPQYVIPTRQKQTVAKLKEESKRADKIILSTDPDREGEAISWHLKEILKLKDYERVSFHEITKEAILKALKTPAKIDNDLVNAQKARRILDRLVGYKLSPVLWKKIYRDFSLSAGRVQSVALRLVAEREKEINDFQPKDYWLVYAHLINQDSFRAKLIKIQDKSITKPGIVRKAVIEKIKSDLEDNTDFKVEKINKKEITKNPFPPYTTSSLQQDAWIRLNYSAKYTMSLAQSLYEKGLITYHRTDSFNLATSSKKQAKKIIESKYGKKYYKERNYKSKGNTQEAHEAIRPTDPARQITIKQTSEKKLYELIRKRFLASQMVAAKLNQIKIDIRAINKKSYLFRISGQKITFDGFTKVYPIKIHEKDLPTLTKGEKLSLQKLEILQKKTLPPSRYSEATLIKELEKNGIGRPSTYAPILTTILNRGYVKKEDKKLKATDVGMVVNNLLVTHFPKIVDLQFTAKMEDDLDKIAEGKKNWQKVLKNFYEPFIKNIKDKDQNLEKQNILKKTSEKCKKCKKGNLVIKLGRNGKFKACNRFPECDYTEPIEDEAEDKKKMIEAFGTKKCPQCSAKMEIKQGRYGMFWSCSNYPKCKHTEKLEKKTNIPCPKCQNGYLIKKGTRKGTIFYGCSNYPKCKFSLNNEPTGEKCPKCNSLLVKKDKEVICSNKKCDYKK